MIGSTSPNTWNFSNLWQCAAYQSSLCFLACVAFLKDEDSNSGLEMTRKQMVWAIAIFMEFCYIIRQSMITTEDLIKLEELLVQFHKEHEIFWTEGVCDDFNLPHQHSLKHYCNSICKFGTPNGLCSSIMESWHITVVKSGSSSIFPRFLLFFLILLVHILPFCHTLVTCLSSHITHHQWLHS